MSINFEGETLKFESTPKYLGVKLDRSLTYEPHIKDVCQKMKTRINLVQRIAGVGWGANAKTLRTTVMGLVIPTAEYCCSSFINSSHTSKIDVQINRALRIISGTIKSTPLHWLPVMANIEPPKFRRQVALNHLYSKCDSHQNSLLYHLRNELPNQRLKRKPPWTFENQEFDLKIAWNQSWTSNNIVNQDLVTNPSIKLPGFEWSRNLWSRLNRFRCEQGRCNYLMDKWGLLDNPYCDCGPIDQRMLHIVNECALRAFDGGLQRLHLAKEDAESWLKQLDISI